MILRIRKSDSYESMSQVVYLFRLQVEPAPETRHYNCNRKEPV